MWDGDFSERGMFPREVPVAQPVRAETIKVVWGSIYISSTLQGAEQPEHGAFRHRQALSDILEPDWATRVTQCFQHIERAIHHMDRISVKVAWKASASHVSVNETDVSGFPKQNVLGAVRVVKPADVWASEHYRSRGRETKVSTNPSAVKSMLRPPTSPSTR